MLGDVAIAVVEGEAGEAPVIALLEPLHGLIEGDHVEARFLHLIEHRIEEVRCHFENAIRREVVWPVGLGTHMVQREDHAHPLGIRGQQAVRARMVQSRHCCLHHRGFHIGHGNSPLCAINH